MFLLYFIFLVVCILNKVAEVDRDGDVRLCNPSGLVSGFSFRKDYGFITQEENMRACAMANQAAFLALQNACFEQENMLLRMQQGQVPYGLEDPSGYMQNPWAMPTPCPSMYA